MAGFTDLVERAQPALVGGGVEARATEGRTWSWTFVDIVDDDGNPIDLTAGAGVTGTCVIEENGTNVATLTYTGGVGEFTVSHDEASTAGLANTSSPRRTRWSMFLDNGAASVQVWNLGQSPFLIDAE